MISTYCLGVHIGHDRGAALVKDGVLVACVGEERLDRRKHSNSPEIPMRAIRAVLDVEGIQVGNLAAAAISYTNVVIGDIIGQLADELRDLLKTPALEVFGASHHECHALSTYFTSGERSALVVVADGAGDIIEARIEAESVYEGNGATLSFVGARLQDFGLTRIDRRNTFNTAYMHSFDCKKQISLGRKYEQLTYLIGFGHGQSGKTMGLAAYAQPLFEIPAQEGVGLGFSLTFVDALDNVTKLWSASGKPWHRFIHDNRAALAASAQVLIENYMVGLLNDLHHERPSEALCVAGGLFLNCKMNHEILRRTPFQRLHIFPAAGDDGQAVGAALHAYRRVAVPSAPHTLEAAYFGPSHSNAEISDRIEHFGLYAKFYDNPWLIERMADDLAAGKVIGLLRGRSEIGPRALGHRSILADPRRPGMKDMLNRIKGRESFRPFAPMTTSEDQFEYFDLAQSSPFMLLATYLKPKYHDALPAIVHADGTSRVQAVSRTIEPFLHDLLKAFEARTGFPIILNTSFNLAGEPIVQSPHDAISTYLRSNIDVLVMENFCIDQKTSRISACPR
jgi:carbamoyltransferase